VNFLRDKYAEEKLDLENKLKWGMFPTFTLFAFIPWPFEPVKIYAILTRYDLKLLMLGTFIGRAPRYALIAWGAGVMVGNSYFSHFASDIFGFLRFVSSPPL